MMSTDEERVRNNRFIKLFLKVERADGASVTYPIVEVHVVEKSNRPRPFSERYLKVTLPSETIVVHTLPELANVLKLHHGDLRCTILAQHDDVGEAAHEKRVRQLSKAVMRAGAKQYVGSRRG